MINTALILFGKSFSKLSKTLNFGNGSTWPGHIALQTNKHFIRETIQNSRTKVIFVAGTNGKTTTSSLIRTILEQDGRKVYLNQSGANLLNGLASTIISTSNTVGKITADYLIFEVDENALPLALQEITPHYVILLNLFRDQLDRYGEINAIANKWKEALSHLSESSLVLNADDPQIAYLGEKTKAKVTYFGLDEKKLNDVSYQHAADSTYCPNCGEKLRYKTTYFSHLGDYTCSHCSFKRPPLSLSTTQHPLSGIYNRYNTLAAVLTAKEIGVTQKTIDEALHIFRPAFGRQEIIMYNGKKVQLFLSKNPTSFNQSFRTISELGAKTLIISLNDRVPDGRDISWIWDADLPNIQQYKNIIVTGDRVYDMALRIKYEEYKNFLTFEKPEDALHHGIDLLDKDETLFILPTYSAMLETRKILTGKKIL